MNLESMINSQPSGNFILFIFFFKFYIQFKIRINTKKEVSELLARCLQNCAEEDIDFLSSKLIGIYQAINYN